MPWILIAALLLGGCSGTYVVDHGNATCKVDHRHATPIAAYGLAVCTEKASGRFLAMDLERGTSAGELATKVAVGVGVGGLIYKGLKGIDTGTEVTIPGVP